MYIYRYDIHRKEVVIDCKLYPTDVLQSESPWLYAKSNKYSYDSINSSKIGKWMLFLSKDKVNEVWDKIKIAVANAELWDSKVSTVNNYLTHAIIIYTKDYADEKDVINVLSYLESSGIKPPQVTIYYKADQQTSAGVYSGGKLRPWLYSSATIRESTKDFSESTVQSCKKKLKLSDFVYENMYSYHFDIDTNEVVTDCKLYPADIIQDDSPWLFAKNNKYSYEDVDPQKVGKWMLFLSKDKVNEVWDKIKMAVADGELWDTKVSTVNPKYFNHAVMIYTKDYTDLDDVIDVLNYLESSEIKPPKVTVYYKTDQQTHAGIYSGIGQKPWIYSSATIRGTKITF